MKKRNKKINNDPQKKTHKFKRTATLTKQKPGLNAGFPEG